MRIGQEFDVFGAFAEEAAKRTFTKEGRKKPNFVTDSSLKRANVAGQVGLKANRARKEGSAPSMSETRQGIPRTVEAAMAEYDRHRFGRKTSGVDEDFDRKMFKQAIEEHIAEDGKVTPGKWRQMLDTLKDRTGRGVLGAHVQLKENPEQQDDPASLVTGAIKASSSVPVQMGGAAASSLFQEPLGSDHPVTKGAEAVGQIGAQMVSGLGELNAVVQGAQDTADEGVAGMGKNIALNSIPIALRGVGKAFKTAKEFLTNLKSTNPELTAQVDELLKRPDIETQYQQVLARRNEILSPEPVQSVNEPTAKPATIPTKSNSVPANAKTTPETGTAKEPWQMTRDEYLGPGTRVFKGVPNDLERIDARQVGKKAAGYFTDSRDVAQTFTHVYRRGMAHVTEATLDMRRPFTVDANGRPAREFMTDALNPAHNNPELVKALDSPEYDGLIIKNTADEGTVFLAKNPDQIKSLVDHRTAVAKALAEGKPVPPEVLADYPDLKPKQTPEPAQLAEPVRRTVADIDADLEANLQRIKQKASLAAKGRTSRRGAVTVDAEDLKLLAERGKLHFEKGYRTFEEWARKMVAEIGDHIRPHLSAIWKEVQGSPDAGPQKNLSLVLEDARQLRAGEVADLQSQVRSRQAARLAASQAEGKGLGNIGKEMGTLKGGYANYVFELPANLDPTDVQHVSELIDAHSGMGMFEKTRAKAALQKLFGLDPDGTPGFGVLPQPNEIASLSKVFGPEFGMKVREMRRPSLWQEASMFRKLGLLFNPRTMIRNFVGNLTKTVRDEGLRPADVALDMLLKGAKVTKDRSFAGFKPTITVGTAKRTTMRAVRDIQDVAKYGSESTFGEAMPESRFAVTKAMQRFQGVQDVPWKALAYEQSFLNQARMEAKALGLKGKAADAHVNNLLDNPNESMVEQAKMDAEFATFNQENKVADVLNADSLTDVGKFFVDLVMPFKTVPLNIGADIATSNPAGALYNLAKIMRKARAGELTGAEQRHLIRSVNNGALGTGLWWLGWQLASQGKVIGAPAKDLGLRNTQEATGDRPMSIETGGRRYQMSGVSPFVNVLLLGATAYGRTKERAEREQAAAQKTNTDPFNPAPEAPMPTSLADAAKATLTSSSGFDSFASVLNEQPFFQGIKDIVRLGEQETSLNQYGGELASSFVPTAVEDLGRTFGGDKTVKRPEGATMGQAVADALKERTGRGLGVADKVDAFGQPVKMGDNPFDITNNKEVKDDEVSQFLRKHRIRLSVPGKDHKESERDYSARKAEIGKAQYEAIKARLPFLQIMESKGRVGLQKEVDKIVKKSRESYATQKKLGLRK